MKYILHNLHMIRARFRSNGWVLAELFVVFLVMWYLCDSLGCLKYTFYRPLGMDISHVYQLSTIEGGESRDTTLTTVDKYFNLLEKLQALPEVECAALSYFSLPMSGQNSYSMMAANDSVGLNVRNLFVTADYCRVFRMTEDERHPFAGLPTDGYHVMLTKRAYELFKEHVPGFSLDTKLFDGRDTSEVFTQCGVIGSIRTYRYGSDARSVFHRIDRAFSNENFDNNWAQLTFRLKPSADTPDFRARFNREIAPRLDVDNVFVADAVPYTTQQHLFEVMNGDVDRVNTQMLVAFFLLVNVFLGLIGTFWYRTRRRRSEIGLRMSMGSSRRNIFCLLMGEGLLLLTMAALPAMFICYAVAIAEPSVGHTALISTWPVKWSGVRFLLGSVGAWLLMALMVVVGIWFPAHKAMRIQPADALHEE